MKDLYFVLDGLRHYYPACIIKSGHRNYDGIDPLRKNAFRSAISANKVKDLFTFRNDAKTIKGEKYGVSTIVVYLAPGNVSGYEVCRKRTVGCSASCLFTAGQGRFPNVKQGRLRRTYQFFHRRDEFVETLASEIFKYKIIVEREGKQLAVRLNGTSDIAYEDILLPSTNLNIFDTFPRTQFYDYTKIVERLPYIVGHDNYNATFSRAETRANHDAVQLAMSMGVNVTVVFRDELPPVYMGLPVVDGDRHDIRFQDSINSNGKSVVIGLLAKGDAKKDTTGFVVDLD